MRWIFDVLQENETCSFIKFICLSLDWRWVLSASVWRIPRHSEHWWALTERSYNRGYPTGVRLVRRNLVNIVQTLRHVECWSVCGHQETGTDSRAVQADPNWHCLGRCHLEVVTDYVALDKLFSLSGPWCPHLHSDLGLETLNNVLINNATGLVLVELRIQKNIWMWGVYGL